MSRPRILLAPLLAVALVAAPGFAGAPACGACPDELPAADRACHCCAAEAPSGPAFGATGCSCGAPESIAAAPAAEPAGASPRKPLPVIAPGDASRSSPLPRSAAGRRPRDWPRDDGPVPRYILFASLRI